MSRLTTPCCKNPSQPSAHRTAGALVALRARVALQIHEGWRTTMARLDSSEACGALGPGDDARVLPAFLTLLTILDALAWWLRGADFLPLRVRVFFVELGERDDLIMVEPLVGGPLQPVVKRSCQHHRKRLILLVLLLRQTSTAKGGQELGKLALQRQVHH